LSRRTNLVDLDPSANPSLQRLQALSATYVDTMNTRLERAASYKALLTASPETTAHAFQPGLIGTMRSEVLKLERDYEAQLKVYKPDWPPMVALKGELDRSKQHLAAAVKQAVAAARQSAYAAYEAALARSGSSEPRSTSSNRRSWIRAPWAPNSAHWARRSRAAAKCSTSF